ncbi:MAG: hypothetical protein IPL35_05445 [Sphingobacteriales bacterium]|nr:hypothetical protein [Sphingobacteriales bacterium]
MQQHPQQQKASALFNISRIIGTNIALEIFTANFFLPLQKKSRHSAHIVRAVDGSILYFSTLF